MAVHQPQPHKHLPRGDAEMMKKKPPVEPNIVQTYQLGNTKVQIADNFVARTPEEIEKVLNNLHNAGWKIIDELIEKGEDV